MWLDVLSFRSYPNFPSFQVRHPIDQQIAEITKTRYTTHDNMMIVRSKQPHMLEPRRKKKVAMRERSTLNRTPVRARASDRMGIQNTKGDTQQV